MLVEMADADPQFKRLLLPAEETLFEQLLRFGLYVGAMFQIMCLLAIVVYQAGPSDGVAALKVPSSWTVSQTGAETDDPSDVECSENSPQVTPRRPHRPRKQEKKKRR
ncbi:Protein anon-73B1 [Temnothorax longispinosus]|uniref:Protein anon-73B1 n=1 Tax=Temnothorax longispinosus TaxID=300112 RepID=A0A4S2KAJ7_9HYME|nr:Protein anon-73B1 [Temnothorax longispinosus]